MWNDWLGYFLLIGIGYLIFIVRSSSKKYIDMKFDEQIERLKSELQKTLIHTKAKYDYTKFTTKEAYNVTIDLYHRIFNAKEIFHKLWNRKLDSETSNKYIQQLREHQIKLFYNQILIDENIFDKFRNLFGEMIAISLDIQMDMQVKSDRIKNLNNELVTVTNLIREKFGLNNIPQDIVGIEIQNIKDEKKDN